ncbi:uncharacterized protein LOC123194767 isoform X1 [Mangifera indica]|uniref:uncharacterized protein LOC123194767 isoform X1 n=1 Tax=Mangifera indica TaxID=29780 RepID=UPI001CF95F7D|nr:uncharacterized protein LOC123194767 isoform X1 [Mangifera indica]
MSLSLCECVFHFNFSPSDSLSLFSLTSLCLRLPNNNGDIISSSLSLMATTMEAAQFRAGFIVIFFKRPGMGSNVFQPCLATHGGHPTTENLSRMHQNIFELPAMDSYNVFGALEEANPPQPHVEEFQPQVTKHLKEIVLQAVRELKLLCQPLVPQNQEGNNVITDVVPISFRMMQTTNPKRSKEKLIGDITRSFTLPVQLLVGHEDD